MINMPQTDARSNEAIEGPSPGKEEDYLMNKVVKITEQNQSHLNN